MTEDVGWSLGAGAGNGPSGLAGGRLSAQPSGHWGLGRRASAGRVQGAVGRLRSLGAGRLLSGSLQLSPKGTTEGR